MATLGSSFKAPMELFFLQYSQYISEVLLSGLLFWGLVLVFGFVWFFVCFALFCFFLILMK